MRAHNKEGRDGVSPGCRVVFINASLFPSNPLDARPEACLSEFVWYMAKRVDSGAAIRVYLNGVPSASLFVGCRFRWSLASKQASKQANQPAASQAEQLENWRLRTTDGNDRMASILAQSEHDSAQILQLTILPLKKFETDRSNL